MMDRDRPVPAEAGVTRHVRALALAAALVTAACAAERSGGAAPSASVEASVGAPDAGDPYYPGAGNGGYDVQHYDLVFDVDMEADRIEAVATVTAIALHDLSRFHLDLHGLEVASVHVDGEAARYRRDGRELIVEPARTVRAGEELDVRVAYSGTPEPSPDPSVERMGVPGVGWWRTDSGVYIVSECIGAPSWFPCNDHPTDKATFSYRVTVDAPFVVAANGLLVGETQKGNERTYEWRASDPMATYLATMNIAPFEVRVEEGPRGMPLRLYYPEGAEEKELEPFARTAEMIEFFESRFGPYPFEAFGGVMAYEQLGGALETQTLPVYSRGAHESVVAHELAHQWFGDCVSPALWRDMWLNEGFAVYAEWLWREHTRGAEALERRAGQTYRFLRRREVGRPFDPGVQELFSGRVYLRGAWVLHALRREVGDPVFFEILRSWVEAHHDGNASTEDFVAHAERVAGRELDELFDTWLYGDVVPEVAEYERRSRRDESDEADEAREKRGGARPVEANASPPEDGPRDGSDD